MLNRRVSITVPGTDHGRPILHAQQDAAVNSALKAFSKWFGGATAISGRGAWISEASGELVVEAVVVVYSYCDDSTLAANRANVLGHVERLAASLGQECVAVEWPEGMDFVACPVKTAA
jgi:hypothetical protein